MNLHTRGVSTVADVALAIVLIVAAITLLGTVAEDTDDDHDHRTADRTATMLAGSTMNLTHSVADVHRAAATTVAEYEVETADVDELPDSANRQVNHATLAGHLATLAITHLTVDGRELEGGHTDVRAAVDEAIQARLLEAKNWANVTAEWLLFDRGHWGIQASIRVGPPIPPQTDVSTATMTVPSGFEDVRADAVTAAKTGEFEPVAKTVAREFIESLLPPLESQRALESTGSDRLRTVYRYLRLAELVGDDGSAESVLGLSNLTRQSGDAEALTAALVDAYTTWLTNELEEQFETPTAAAEAVSMHEVTVVVRTWES